MSPARRAGTTPLTQKRVPVRPADAYYEQMRNFAAVIRGKEKPVMSGADGTRTLATTLAITRIRARPARRSASTTCWTASEKDESMAKPCASPA